MRLMYNSLFAFLFAVAFCNVAISQSVDNDSFNGKWVISKEKSNIGANSFYRFPEWYEVKANAEKVTIKSIRSDSTGKKDEKESVYEFGKKRKETVGGYQYDVIVNLVDHPGFNVLLEELDAEGKLVYRVTNHWHQGENQNEIIVYRTEEVPGGKQTCVTVYVREK